MSRKKTEKEFYDSKVRSHSKAKRRKLAGRRDRFESIVQRLKKAGAVRYAGSFLEEYILRLGVRKADIILDFGGRYSSGKLAQNYGFQSCVLNISRLEIQEGVESARMDENPFIWFVQGDAENLPFRDQVFHFVYCSAILHHLPNPFTGLKEIRRVLRFGGKVIIVAEPNPYSPVGSLGRKTKWLFSLRDSSPSEKPLGESKLINYLSLNNFKIMSIERRRFFLCYLPEILQNYPLAIPLFDSKFLDFLIFVEKFLMKFLHFNKYFSSGVEIVAKKA